MINTENVKKAIQIMQRADERGSLNMCRWQFSNGGGEKHQFEQFFNTCGNTACFAGHVAISPEFQADGGSCDSGGAPIFNGKFGHHALEEWLGCTESVSHCLVYGAAFSSIGPDDYSPFYKKVWSEVTAQDVIDKLTMLLNGELE